MMVGRVRQHRSAVSSTSPTFPLLLPSYIPLARIQNIAARSLIIFNDLFSIYSLTFSQMCGDTYIHDTPMKRRQMQLLTRKCQL